MIWSHDSYYPNWNFERNVFGTTDCVSLLFCCSQLYGFFNKPQSNQASKKEHSKESTNLCDTDILSFSLFVCYFDIFPLFLCPFSPNLCLPLFVSRWQCPPCFTISFPCLFLPLLSPSIVFPFFSQLFQHYGNIFFVVKKLKPFLLSVYLFYVAFAHFPCLTIIPEGDKTSNEIKHS